MFVLKDHDLWAKFKDHTDKVLTASAPSKVGKKANPRTLAGQSVHFNNIRPIDWPYRWFLPLEAACKGTGLVPLYSRHFHYTMERLDLLRELDGSPMFLRSMYRTPVHNRNEGGSKGSYHMQGMAADIVLGHRSHDQVAAMAMDLGFNGIGRYPKRGFIHIDTRVRGATWEG